MRAAVVVTDRFGDVQTANAAAQALIAGGDGLALAAGRLAAADPGTTAALRAAILTAALGGEPPAGQGVPEIAATLDRSVETVRTHLKSVQAKTGVQRQADLARLVAGLRAGLG